MTIAMVMVVNFRIRGIRIRISTVEYYCKIMMNNVHCNVFHVQYCIVLLLYGTVRAVPPGQRIHDRSSAPSPISTIRYDTIR